MRMIIDTWFHIWFIWQFITKSDESNYKIRQLFKYKMRQKFITKCVRFLITKCNSYYKMRRLLQIATVHSIQYTSWDSLKKPLLSMSQKQPSRYVLRKSCSENIQQIYRRTPMPKCDFNKFAKQLTLWHACSLANLLHISRTHFYKNTSGRLLLMSVSHIFFLTTTITLANGLPNISKSHIKKYSILVSKHLFHCQGGLT